MERNQIVLTPSISKLINLLQELGTTEHDIVRRFEVYDAIEKFKPEELALASAYLLDKVNNPNLKLYILELLVRIDSETSVSYLLELLDYDEVAIRRWCCSVLSQTRSTKAVLPLVNILKKDPSADVRVIAAHALGRIGDTRALPSLLYAQEHDLGRDFENFSVSETAKEAVETIERHNSLYKST